MKTLLLGIHSLVLIVLLSGAVSPVALAQTATKAHFLKQGTRADLIRFSDTIWEAKERGQLDDFVKHMADKTRDSCGPVKK